MVPVCPFLDLQSRCTGWKSESPQDGGKVIIMKKSVGIPLLAALSIALGTGSVLYFTGDDYHTKRYLKLAEQCFEKGVYEETLAYCTAALELDCTLTEAYRIYSDACLAEGKCEEAVQALMDGVDAAEAAELSEREAYLREHIVVVRECSCDETGNEGIRKEYEYDESGNCTKLIASYGLEEYEYDADGNLTRKVTCGFDGSIFGWEEYKYINGNCIKFTEYDGKGRVVHWEEYVYDTDGNRIRESGYYSDGPVSYWEESEYDADGNKIKDVSHHSDGNIPFWQEYAYDENGNRTGYAYYGGSGNLHLRSEFEYDSEGRLIRRLNYGGDGSLSDWEEYEYDENGNLMKFLHYDSNGSIYDQYVQECNVLGQVVSESRNGGRAYRYSYQYKYIGE